VRDLGQVIHRFSPAFPLEWIISAG